MGPFEDGRKSVRAGEPLNPDYGSIVAARKDDDAVMVQISYENGRIFEIAQRNHPKRRTKRI